MYGTDWICLILVYMIKKQPRDVCVFLLFSGHFSSVVCSWFRFIDYDQYVIDNIVRQYIYIYCVLTSRKFHRFFLLSVSVLFLSLLYPTALRSAKATPRYSSSRSSVWII